MVHTKWGQNSRLYIVPTTKKINLKPDFRFWVCGRGKIVFKARRLKICANIVLTTGKINLKPDFIFFVCGWGGVAKDEF